MTLTNFSAVQMLRKRSRSKCEASPTCDLRLKAAMPGWLRIHELDLDLLEATCGWWLRTGDLGLSDSADGQEELLVVAAVDQLKEKCSFSAFRYYGK